MPGVQDIPWRWLSKGPFCRNHNEIGAFDHYVPCKSTNILKMDKNGGSFWIMTNPYYAKMAVLNTNL